MPNRVDLDAVANASGTDGRTQNSAILTSNGTFEIAIPPTVLDQPTFEAVDKGKFRLYVWGRVDYDDVFREPHWLTFCYSWDGKSIRDAHVVETCPNHNDSDF